MSIQNRKYFSVLHLLPIQHYFVHTKKISAISTVHVYCHEVVAVNPKYANRIGPIIMKHVMYVYTRHAKKPHERYGTWYPFTSVNLCLGL